MGLLSRLLSRVLPRAAGPTATALTARGSALPGLPIWSQFQRIGGNVTPARVSSIIRLADDGYTYQLCDLSNELRQKDNHLQCVLSTRENALSDLPLQVQAWRARGEREPTDHAQLVADVVEDGLTGATSEDLADFSTLLEHMQGGVYYGYAMAETAWEVRNGYQLPAGWICHPPRRFGFDRNTGLLGWWDQAGVNVMQKPVMVQQLWPGRWVQYQPRTTGDVVAREGLCRPLLWATIFRTWDISDWLRLAELTYKPFRIGRYKQKADDQAIDDLLDILDKLGSNACAVLNEFQDVEVSWPTGSSTTSSAHENLAGFLAEEMSKAVLGQTLTTEAGDRGARALGEVHDQVRHDIRDRDAVRVMSCVIRDVVRWIVRLNFGDAEPLPRVWLETDEPEALGEFSTAIKTLVETGVRIPERYVYEQTGIPKPTEDESVVGEPTEREIAEAEKEPVTAPVTTPPTTPGEPEQPEKEAA